MSAENSPNYAQGAADALRDNGLAAQHEGSPVGPQPPNLAYPFMYLRGYWEHFAPVPHVCSDACPKG